MSTLRIGPGERPAAGSFLETATDFHEARQLMWLFALFIPIGIFSAMVTAQPVQGILTAFAAGLILPYYVRRVQVMRARIQNMHIFQGDAA